MELPRRDAPAVWRSRLAALRLPARPSGLAALAVPAVGFVALYLGLALLRMGYPYELEWMEGGSLQNVQRILAGERIYGPPSLEFIPFLYTPLYYYVSAVLAWLLGAELQTLRLVSFLASLGSLGLIFRLVRHETGDAWAALLAAGLFAATFRLSGAWFDIARVDSLFLFLALASAYWVRAGRTPAALAVAGLLGGLAYLTKQQALPMLLPLGIYLWHVSRPGFLAWGGALAAVVLGSQVALDRLHGGWYAYYTLYLPRQHELVEEAVLEFWTLDLLRPLGVALTLGAAAWLVRARQGDGPGAFFHLALAAGALGASWLSRVHTGGWDNVLMPAHAAVAVLFGLAASQAAGRSSPRLPLPGALLVTALLVQFASLAYLPRKQLPSAQDARAGDGLVAWIAAQEGQVWMPYHGYLAHRAGKAWLAHGVAVNDILRGHPHDPARQDLIRQIRQAMADRSFSTVVLDAFDYRPHIRLRGYSEIAAFIGELSRHYRPAGVLLDGEEVLWPVTGVHSRPAVVYRPAER